MPTVMFSNVRTVRNKGNVLESCAKYQHDYTDSSLICLMETWLQDVNLDSMVVISGFTLLQCDRKDPSNKKCGGGVCAYKCK